MFPPCGPEQRGERVSRAPRSAQIARRRGRLTCLDALQDRVAQLADPLGERRPPNDGVLLQQAPDRVGLDPQQQRLVRLTYERFVRYGATLTGEARERYAAINGRLAQTLGKMKASGKLCALGSGGKRGWTSLEARLRWRREPGPL